MISGAHKTLPAMTQTSFLHLKGGRVPERDISRALAVIESTSPSYILMASLDIARKLAATRGCELLGRVIDAARKAQLKLNGSPGVRCLTEEDVASKGFRHDPTKLVVSLDSLHMTGFEVAEMLRKKHSTEVEFSDIVNIIAILTMMDTEHDVSALAEALSEIAENEGQRREKAMTQRRDIGSVLADLSHVLKDLPKQVMTPREAVFSQWEQVEVARATGRISADTIVPYPPGIILICPGQEITGALTDFMIHGASSGVRFHGVKDDCVLVVA